MRSHSRVRNHGSPPPDLVRSDSAFAVDAGRVRLAEAADEGRAAGDTSRVSQRANNARANWSPASRTQSSRTMTNQATNAARSTQIAPIAAGLMAASALRSNGIDKLEMAGLTGGSARRSRMQKSEGQPSMRRHRLASVHACSDETHIRHFPFRRAEMPCRGIAPAATSPLTRTGRQQPWDRRPFGATNNRTFFAKNA